MPEQKTSSLTAKSRRFKEGQKEIEKLPTPDSHVNGEKDTKTTIYNTKRDARRMGMKKIEKERKVEERQK